MTLRRYEIGACSIKLNTAVNVTVLKEARVFATAIHFNPSLIFSCKAKAYQRLHLLNTAVIAVLKEARVFATAIHFNSSLIFSGKAKAY
jgi:hypothetical protein